MGPIEAVVMEAYNGGNDGGVARIGTMNRSYFGGAMMWGCDGG
jgi:hypothetical protein